jgi:hypothetical protein
MNGFIYGIIVQELPGVDVAERQAVELIVQKVELLMPQSSCNLFESRWSTCPPMHPSSIQWSASGVAAQDRRRTAVPARRSRSAATTNRRTTAASCGSPSFLLIHRNRARRRVRTRSASPQEAPRRPR